jgi:hypothetical protein
VTKAGFSIAGLCLSDACHHAKKDRIKRFASGFLTDTLRSNICGRSANPIPLSGQKDYAGKPTGEIFPFIVLRLNLNQT